MASGSGAKVAVDATIAGGLLEFSFGYGGGTTVTFSSAGGILQLDKSTMFAGKISGLAASTGALDLRDIDLAGATLGYTGDSGSGVLAVGTGRWAAHLALVGQYTVADFSVAADGHGGTMITISPVSSGAGLAPPH